jgi:deoxycytidine triphosphate deaminase
MKAKGKEWMLKNKHTIMAEFGSNVETPENIVGLCKPTDPWNPSRIYLYSTVPIILVCNIG